MWCIADSLMTIFSDKAIVFCVIGGMVAILWILCATIASILSTRAREKTRREIAAYLAEGTIDRDTALAMMKSGGAAEDEDES